MLTELSVKNLALIEQLNLVFGPGFNVMTGETGAGKSIIIGAINLILGGRASADLIRLGAEEAEVQALFIPSPKEPIDRKLEEIGLPTDEQVLVRRVLPRNGRNRVYINGALATLAQLALLGRELVSVSGQHEHQQLLDPDHQLFLLDRFGRLEPFREEMRLAHQDLIDLEAELRSTETAIKTARDKADLYEFQAREIREAGLVPGEDEELEKERSLVRNAEKLFGLVKESYDLLYGESGAVVEILAQATNNLERAAGIDETLAPTLNQIEDAGHQIEDAARNLGHSLDRFVFDPRRLEEIEERLVWLNKLKRKYGPELSDILEYGRRAAGHLEETAALEDRRRELAAGVEAARTRTRNVADDLSTRRKRAARDMADRAAEELKSLSMPHFRFEVDFSEPPENVRPGPLGYDEIQFMISPNIGEEVRPLARIASGGELSRIMLVLKSLLAGQDRIQTIIFDEVDAGIGGQAAEVVGRKIKDLAAYHQVLCITHLPQIAVFGRSHFQVFKEVKGRRTLTGIRPLAPKDRAEEVARLLGGDPTPTTLAAAREMLVKAE